MTAAAVKPLTHFIVRWYSPGGLLFEVREKLPRSTFYPC